MQSIPCKQLEQTVRNVVSVWRHDESSGCGVGTHLRTLVGTTVSMRALAFDQDNATPCPWARRPEYGPPSVGHISSPSSDTPQTMLQHFQLGIDGSAHSGSRGATIRVWSGMDLIAYPNVAVPRWCHWSRMSAVRCLLGCFVGQCARVATCKQLRAHTRVTVLYQKNPTQDATKDNHDRQTVLQFVLKKWG